MRSLRLLHVTPYFDRAWAYGGIPRLASAVTSELARRGHHVTVCTTDAMSADARLSAPSGVRTGSPWEDPDAAAVSVHVFPNLSNHLAYQWQMFLPQGLRAFLRAHARDFDVAHIHAHRNLPAVIAARELRRAGVPYVLQPNGTAPRIERRHTAKWLFDLTVGRGVMENAARVIAVSEAERRQLHQLGVSDDRIRVVANPMDLSEFEPPIERGRFRPTHGIGDEPVVMFLGKLTPRKRLDVLARAFAQLNRPDARLVIAGNDMGYERELRQLTDQLGIASRATFTGLLRGRDCLEALADADVLVYASKDEIFGLVPLEAILSGTPVIVADDSGCGEVIRSVGGGLIVAEGDAQALARAISAVLDEPAKWRADAASAQPAVRALCAPENVCEKLERVYRELLRP